MKKKLLFLVPSLMLAACLVFCAFACNAYNVYYTDGTSSEDTEATPIGITVYTSSVTIAVGEECILEAVVVMSDGSDYTGTLLWSVDDEDVCTVSYGIVTGVGPGVAIVTVSIPETKYSASFVVTVETPAPVGITLNVEAVTLILGQKATLEVFVEKSDGSSHSGDLAWKVEGGSVSITTSDGNIATVEAVSIGTAIVTVSIPDTDYSASCIVTVVEEPTLVGISLSNEEISLRIGDRASIYCKVEMSDGSRYTGVLVWSVDDEDVCTVSSGIVTAIGFGVATVTVSATGTEYSASCIVKVVKDEALRVGINDNLEGFGSYDYVARTFKGFEIDLACMLGDALGYYDVDFVTVSSDNKIEMLEYGYVDCIVATYTITEERSQYVNFSSPYYTDSVKILMSDYYGGVKLSSLSDISAYLEAASEDGSFKACRVGTVAGTNSYDSFVLYCAEQNISMYDSATGDYFVNNEYENYDACEKALSAGDIDLYVANNSVLTSHIPSSGTLLDDVLATMDYGVATAKGNADTGEDTELTSSINYYIDLWLGDGTIDSLLEKWSLL